MLSGDFLRQGRIFTAGFEVFWAGEENITTFPFCSGGNQLLEGAEVLSGALFFCL